MNMIVWIDMMNICDFVLAFGPKPDVNSADKHLHVSSRSREIQFTRLNKLMNCDINAAKSTINILFTGVHVFMVQNIINMQKCSVSLEVLGF